MKTRHVNYYEVDYRELEREILERYGVEVNLVLSEEWRNDSTHDFGQINGHLDEWEKLELQSILDGSIDPYGITYYFLQKLVEDGFIEKGNYLIQVCW